MIPVDVHWTLYLTGKRDADPWCRDYVTILPPWAEIWANGPSAAQAICEDFFDDHVWHDVAGSEDTRIRVWLDIHSPPEIAARYQVDLERKTKATATRMLPVIAETVDA